MECQVPSNYFLSPLLLIINFDWYEAGTIKVGVSIEVENYEPFYMKNNKTGEITGIYMDITSKIMKKVGMNYEFVNFSSYEDLGCIKIHEVLRVTQTINLFHTSSRCCSEQM